MYGVVTKYVLKPRHALHRVSSAPHIVRSGRHFGAFTPRADAESPSHRPTADQHYGATSIDRQTSQGTTVVAIDRGQVGGREGLLTRARSELPQSKVSVYHYEPQYQEDEETPLMGFVSTVPSNNTLPILLTLTACLGSLLFGFHIGFSSPFEDAVRHTTGLNDTQTNFMFSLISIGAIIGALTSGPLASSLGRRTAILGSALPYILGALTMVFAHSNYIFLCAGRLLIGVGVGASSVLVPLYVAEIAPPDLRGSLGSTSQFFMSAGLVSVNAAGIPAVKDPHLWTVVLLCSLLPVAVMFLVMLCFGCETPRYLMSTQQTEAARVALRRLRGVEWDVEGELNEMMDTEEVGVGSVEHSKEALRAWKEQYMKYFQPEIEAGEEEEGGEWTQLSREEDERYTGEKRTGEKNTLKSLELPSPASITALAPTPASDPPGGSVPASPSLKSSLSSKSHQATPAGADVSSSSTGLDATASAALEAPRDKKTVRMSLPPNTHHSPVDSDDADGDDDDHHPATKHVPSSSSSQPKHSALRRQASATATLIKDSAQSMLDRARSAARRAFPSAPHIPSASSPLASPPGSPKTGLAAYTKRSHLIPLLLGVTLQLLQQWSGINSFMFHLKSMLQDRSAPPPSHQAHSNDAHEQQAAALELNQSNAVYALYGAICVNALQMIMGGVTMILMEKAGRRVWLMLSCFGMSCAAFGLSYAYYCQAANHVKIVLVMFYVASFALGCGPLPWLICSEIFPAAIRSSAVSIATTVNWTNAFVVTATYPLLEGLLTEAGVYAVYAIIIAAGFFFVLLVLPETGGKSLEEIEEMFDKEAQQDREQAQAADVR